MDIRRLIRIDRKNFRIGRVLRNSLHFTWMQITFTLIAILPFILLLGLMYKSYFLLESHSVTSILLSPNWKPLRGEFGFLPFIISSIWITVFALLIAAPICLLSAIHLALYADRWVLRIMHPVIDILSGIPSVIFGVWGIVAIVPLVAAAAAVFNIQSSGYSLLTGAIVLAFMIIPFILNLLIEIFRNIPTSLMEACLSLGFTRWEAIKYVIIRKAAPGIISAFGLGLSRAFGETIAVLMVVGNVAKIPTGIFQPAYPIPALIANNYGEMLSIPLYDSALMLAALLLFILVTFFNLGSRFLIINWEKKI